MSFELPELAYAYEALDPYMSADTLHLHHDKHHQAYVTNLNKLIDGTALASKSLEEIITTTSGSAEHQGIFNNAGQHWNHILFWQCMKKNGGGNLPSDLEKMIVDSFGGYDAFKENFIQAGITQFGSGWAWLIQENDGKLAVMKIANADNPVAHDKHVLMGVDVWEHSYYVDYQNRRPDYLKAFIDNMIDWEFVANRLKK